jgi:hypothetical protein
MFPLLSEEATIEISIQRYEILTRHGESERLVARKVFIANQKAKCQKFFP